MIAFGPVPSRRLGYSLGINHVPAKCCSYACVYCQVGPTTQMNLKRQEFYPVEQIIEDVERKITACSQLGKAVEFLTLVPDGEPTLDLHLGSIIEQLKQFQIPIAVISNASLIDQPEVQDELLRADWVSLKVDAVDENLWRKINRPHRLLSLSRMLNGMLAFRKKYCGELVTESMLVAGLNDTEEAAHSLCDFLLDLQPLKSYLSIPTRPPAESWVSPPSAGSLQAFIKVCSDRISGVNFLFESEVGDFISTGNLAEDILSITAVHPLREKALQDMVAQASGTWAVVQALLDAGALASIQYRDERYFLRSFKKR